MKPTYEVVISTAKHRNAEYLAEAVESFKAQGVEPVVTFDSRHWFVNWNDAIENCKSELLFLAHDDDTYSSSYISEMVAFMEEHPNIVAGFCMDRFIDGEGRRIPGGTMLPFPESDSKEYDFKTVLNNMLAFGNFLRCETVVLRIPLVGDARYRREIADGAGDTAFWFEILSKHDIGILNKQLVFNRQHTQSATEPQRTAPVADHWAAMDYAVSLRPEALDWDKYISLEAIREKNNENMEAFRVKEKTRNETRVRLVVVHEPPDNAGTGVVAAHRVRKANEGEGEIAYYVFPNPELTSVQEGFYRGCPVMGCGPEMLPLIVKRLKPYLIEYHHTLIWGDEILQVETDARKELYLHDQWMWSDNPHADGKARDTKAFIKGIKVYGNSRWTCEKAKEKLGVDVELFDPFVPLPFKAIKFRKRVGFFGGFHPTKGVDVLLQAARKLPDVLFVLFSQPPADICDGRRIHGHSNVVIVGSYTRSDMHLIANLVEMVVVPSSFESYGLVKKEIESLGVRVVATRVGGMEGAIEPNNVEALVEAITCE